MITTDCGLGAHFGYGYIDNWCGNCDGSSTGTVNISYEDTCISKENQVHVNYTLPTAGTSTGSVIISLQLYQNGFATGYTLVSPNLTSGVTYDFNLNADSLPCNGSGYDLVATAFFTLGSANYSITSPDPISTEGIRPGRNNDLMCCTPISEICSLTDIRMTWDSACCHVIEISNQYGSEYFSGISVSSDNLTISNISSDINWGTITYNSPTQVVYSTTSNFNGIPVNSGGFQALGSVCFTGTGSSNIVINFIGPGPDYDSICSKEFNIECGTPLDTTCVSLIDLNVDCMEGLSKMKFKLKNNSNFTMRGLTLYSQNPDVSFNSTFLPIPDLLPGQVSSINIESNLIIQNNSNNVCFFLSACDQNTKPGDLGIYPMFCCMDSILYCADIPACNACDGIQITAISNDPVKCCYDLTLQTNYTNSNIAYLEFNGIGGTQFAIFTGWTIMAPVGSSHIKIMAPGGGIPPGIYSDFASFCLTGTSSSPHEIIINTFDANDNKICTNTLQFESCQLVEPSCANIVDDLLKCDGDKLSYSFNIKNNAPFTLYQVDLRTSDSSVVLGVNHIELIPEIAPGNIGGPYTISIDSIDKNLAMFCLYLTGHNAIYDPEHGIAATQCCTDSLGIVCLPLIQCGDCDTTICCDFSNMTISNGITPNEDGINDVFNIIDSDCCPYISITVFNRWGNIVYQNSDYKNDWKGVNQSGQKLAQGTYFIVIELPGGNKKGSYIDIRY
ncbi:MAG: gliding motility-associated C-terminal domain-containing protein [Bacteroidales bacterium]|nr:gliding motility-associated C-terminal domain-containing protein [Bacteroidales bacterium]